MAESEETKRSLNSRKLVIFLGATQGKRRNVSRSDVTLMKLVYWHEEVLLRGFAEPGVRLATLGIAVYSYRFTWKSWRPCKTELNSFPLVLHKKSIFQVVSG